MKFDRKLQKALADWAPGRVKYVAGWKTRNTGMWRGPKKVPVMIIEHHTAGAATESVDPKNKGNQPGANNGVVTYCIAKGNSVPYCNAVVDRDGTIFVLAAYPVWHAGLGDFAGSRWAHLGIPKNSANSYTFGTEIVSKGRKKDFTEKQAESIFLLDCALRQASGWKGFKYRVANHKDWAPDRKVDTRYPWQYFRDGAVQAWRSKTLQVS